MNFELSRAYINHNYKCILFFPFLFPQRKKKIKIERYVSCAWKIKSIQMSNISYSLSEKLQIKKKN